MDYISINPRVFGRHPGWLERPTVNAKVATVLGSVPASSDTVESEGQKMKQRCIKDMNKLKKISL